MSMMKRVNEDPKLKALYTGVDEQDFCQECGTTAEHEAYGRQWCDDCWRIFCAEYEEWLKSLPSLSEEDRAAMAELYGESDDGSVHESSTQY